MKGYESNVRIGRLFSEIHSEQIKAEARKAGNSGSWTRQRNMPLHDILTCTLAKKGLSTTMEIRQYFQAAENVEQTVSKQDYLKQRQNLNPHVFEILNRNYLKQFYDGQEPVDWRGYLVLAVDGSRVEIPNSQENRETYGESTNQHGKAVARANFSALYDVYNRFMLDIQIGYYNSSEIEEAKSHIKAVKQISGERPLLILFDRNYASLEFMDYLERAGIKYLIRVQSNAYKAELGQMEGADKEMELAYTKDRMKSLRQSEPERYYELKEKKSTNVRILKAVFGNEESGILMTNLREGTAGEIKRLYRNRWKIEQKYHTLKNKMKFESITGKASIYVAQDFWAQALVFNIVQDLITGAEYRATKKAKKQGLKYKVRINENIAIGLFKEQFIRLIMEEDDQRKAAMFRQLMADIEKYIVPIRKQKSSPRKGRNTNKYKCNQKPSF